MIDKIEEEKQEESIQGFNIEIDGNHNYFVGDSFVLVHNKPVKIMSESKFDISDKQ